jgi:hypothetical protein
VGKKPPQSQKGGSHGLTLQTSVGLSPNEEKEKIKKIKEIEIYIYIIFAGRRRPRGASPGRLCPEGKSKKIKSLYLYLYFILYYLFILFFLIFLFLLGA